MAMRLNTTGRIVLAVLLVTLLWAWIDGGREPQRLIRQAVTLPEVGR
ncbi:MAG: hypothetical protein ABIT09_06150 [Croceibacterium sp.]